jgi:serine/threonine-protein kinase
MAPEAIKATGDAGMASDIWSIGAMTYEQLCGSRPFGAGWMAIPAILKGDPPTIPAFVREKPQFWSLGEPIFEIILSCLAKEPNNRPNADQFSNNV